jgi:hypothetical protein
MVSTEYAAKEQDGYQHNVPDQLSGQKWLVASARWAAHGVFLGWLKSQRYAERDGSNEIDPKNLNRGNRQRHPHEQSHDDRHCFTGIGRQCPADDFLKVVVHGAAFTHGGHDGSEIVIGQYQFGRFFRRFTAFLPHGNTRIGPFERGRIVDPVAGHGHGHPVGLQRHDQPQFVLRAGAGKDVAVEYCLTQGSVIQAIKICPRQYFLGTLKTDLLTDGGSSLDVVTGDHLYPDAGTMTFSDRCNRLGSGRVDHPHHAEQGQ